MTKKERELRQEITNLKEKGEIIASIDVKARTEEQRQEFKNITNGLKNLYEELEQVKTIDNASRHLQGEVLLENNNGLLKFANFGEFLTAVKNVAVTKRVDERLMNAVAGQNEAVDADGGFLVNKDFVNDLMSTVYENSVLFNATSQTSIGSNSNGIKINMPKEGFSGTDGINVYGGARAYWVPEAGTIDLSKTQFERLEIDLNKVAAILSVTGELDQDFSAISSFMAESAGTAIAFSVDDAILNGTGTDQPFGILKSVSLEVVAAEDDSKAITVEDVFNMYAKMRARDRAGAAWYINQDMETQLMRLRDSAGYPLWIAGNSLVGSPNTTLLGKPVIPIEQASPLGKQGDIIFANMKRYISITKGGVRADSSIHVYFDTDQKAFRFILRVGGKPLRSSKFSRAKNAGTYSPFITLGDRSLVTINTQSSALQKALKKQEQGKSLTQAEQKLIDENLARQASSIPSVNDDII